MPLRKLLLRVLLWSLGLAAAFGAAGILLAEIEAIWRIAGTAMWTAVCAGIMLLCSVLVDRPQGRLAGLTGMAVIVAEYLLVLVLIWNLADAMERATGWDWEEYLAIEAFFLLLWALPAMMFLWMARTRVAAVAGWTGLALSVTAFVMASLAVMRDEFLRISSGPEKLYDLTAALIGIAPLAILSLVGVGTGDRRHWRWIGVVFAGLAYLGLAYAIVENLQGDPEPLIALIATACVVAHANVILQVPIPSGQRWLTRATVAAGAVTGACVVLASLLHWRGFLEHGSGEDQILMRLASAAAVFAGCGTLAILVLARLTRRLDVPSLSAVKLEAMTVQCPVCGRKQALSLGEDGAGEASCRGCALILHAGATEPRCPNCDYSLLMFKGDRCPECGTPVVATVE